MYGVKTSSLNDEDETNYSLKNKPWNNIDKKKKNTICPINYLNNKNVGFMAVGFKVMNSRLKKKNEIRGSSVQFPVKLAAAVENS